MIGAGEHEPCGRADSNCDSEENIRELDPYSDEPSPVDSEEDVPTLESPDSEGRVPDLVRRCSPVGFLWFRRKRATVWVA